MTPERRRVRVGFANFFDDASGEIRVNILVSCLLTPSRTARPPTRTEKAMRDHSGSLNRANNTGSAPAGDQAIAPSPVAHGLIAARTQDWR